MSAEISTTLARDLRRNPTSAERNLWTRLRARQIESVKFRRQHPIGDYIVEFCSLERRLVIEIDRGQDAESAAAIRGRHDYLNQRRFHVLRFADNEVLGNMEGVLEAIRDKLQTSSSEE